MSKYDPLRDYLSSLRVTSVTVRFTEIEDIIGQNLPPSARKYSAWWGNNDDGGKRHSVAWLSAGWHTEGLSLDLEQVSFAKDSPTA